MGEGRMAKKTVRRQSRRKLYRALRTLFDLLELYSPTWYKKQHHEQASSALKSARRSARKIRVR